MSVKCKTLADACIEHLARETSASNDDDDDDDVVRSTPSALRPLLNEIQTPLYWQRLVSELRCHLVVSLFDIAPLLASMARDATPPGALRCKDLGKNSRLVAHGMVISTQKYVL